MLKGVALDRCHGLRGLFRFVEADNAKRSPVAVVLLFCCRAAATKLAGPSKSSPSRFINGTRFQACYPFPRVGLGGSGVGHGISLSLVQVQLPLLPLQRRLGTISRNSRQLRQKDRPHPSFSVFSLPAGPSLLITPPSSFKIDSNSSHTFVVNVHLTSLLRLFFQRSSQWVTTARTTTALSTATTLSPALATGVTSVQLQNAVLPSRRVCCPKLRDGAHLPPGRPTVIVGLSGPAVRPETPASRTRQHNSSLTTSF